MGIYNLFFLFLFFLFSIFIFHCLFYCLHFSLSIFSRTCVSDPKVTVHVICTTLPSEKVTSLCNHYHQVVLKTIPGLLSFDAKIITGMTILFSLFETEEEAKQLTALTKDYVSNTNGVQNLFRTDLQAQKTFAIMGVFTSWN